MITKHDIPKNIIEIGPGKDIEIGDFSLYIVFDQQKIVTNQSINFNFSPTSKRVINFEYGDIIGVGGVDIWLEEPKRIEFSYEKDGLYKTSLADVTSIEKSYPDEPFYTNSPLIFHELFTDKVDLETPPEKEKKMSKGDIAKQLIPAVLSIVIVILMLKLRPRGIRGYLMALTSVTSFAISMINVYQTRKEAKEHNRNRTEVYKKYLWEKRYEINQIIADNFEAQNYNYPTQEEIIKLIDDYTFRLYERDSKDPGYLALRLGKAQMPASYEINNPFDKIKLNFEPLEEELKELYERYKNVDGMPLILENYKNIGLIGSRYVIMQQIHSILMQYYFFQSYLDLNLILITKKESQQDFEYLKYIRHIKNPYTNFNNFIVDASSRDQLLNSYSQILRQRKQEYKPGMQFSPHLLFLIDDSKLISNHPIMEFLQADEDLGFTLIYIAQDEHLLPKNVDTIVRYVTETSAEFVMENKKLVNLEFVLEPTCYDLKKLDKIARHIGRLEHIKGIKSSIPEKLGFLEMFEVSNVSDLNIKDRWNNNHAYDSLGCRIGKKSETDYIELNLHEKAHGPHGLVAGTTGSGKSEVIQTYILSLALNYSPYDVGFLLIDYKGGGMANLFKNLPHHLGSITNLDGYQSMRALASIKSELKRRQQIFSDVDVNHINQYHKLLEAKKVSEPLPHLFLISDEFAELKSEQPDFMKELVSAARIGRSLGIHLILATQKPTGVVDEQIWSNSKFKLCLKVAEESDSKELLKTPDAAYITEAGRGYLKVGTNELYELFQSGYSGQPYVEAIEEQVDERIYHVNLFNQHELVNPDVVKEDKDDFKVTELSAVLDEISKTYDNQTFIQIPRPWLPPLSEYIHKTDLVLNADMKFGLMDIPTQQKQIEFRLNFEELGHLAIVGGQGMGKTTAISTILLSYAQNTSPKEIAYLIFDFGNSGLINFKNLKHTMEYITINDIENHWKAIKFLNEELATRKKTLESHMVSNYRYVNDKKKNSIKPMYIVVDNFDMLQSLDDDLFEVISEVAKNGVSLGIFLIISANRSLAIKPTILINFRQRVLLYNGDTTEKVSFLKKSPYELTEIPGRALVLDEEVEFCQIYQSIEQQEADAYLVELNKIISDINDKYSENNIGFVKVPEQLEYEKPETSKSLLYVGMLYSNLNKAKIRLDNILISGRRGTGKTNMLKLILEQIKGTDLNITIVDDPGFSLIEYNEYDNVSYITKLENLENYSDVYIINKLSRINKLKNKEKVQVFEKLYNLLLNGKKFIVETDEKIFGSVKEDFYLGMLSAQYFLYFGKIEDQNLYPVDKNNYKYDAFSLSDGYVVKGSSINKIKIPKVVTGNENKSFELPGLKSLQEKLEYKNNVVIGKNPERLIEFLANQKEKVIHILGDISISESQYIVKITCETMEDLKAGDVLFIESNTAFSQYDMKTKRKYLELFDQKAEELIVYFNISEKVKLRSEYIRGLKKNTNNIVIGDYKNDLALQEAFRIKNRSIKEQEYSDDYFYVIEGKELSKIRY